MKASDLAAIQARCEAATPGEWVYDAPEIFRVEPKPPRGQCPTAIVWEYPNEGGGVTVDADGVFIAHARSDVPALLAEVTRLRGLVEAAYREGVEDGGPYRVDQWPASNACHALEDV